MYTRAGLKQTKDIMDGSYWALKLKSTYVVNVRMVNLGPRYCMHLGLILL